MHSGGYPLNGFGATILDADGPRLSAEERKFFRQADPFGFILFARNVENAAQVRALCDEMRETVGREAAIFVDQEGGRVQRLRPPLARDWPPPLRQTAAAGPHGAQAMYLRYRIIAAELRALGIDGNCAPLVDLVGPETHDFLRDRCYGGAPSEVAEIGRAVADGLLAGGVLPVLKHIPGHGRAAADSHLSLPEVTDPCPVLESSDFAPFRELADLPLAMTAHVVYTAIDSLPATISPAVMRLIREDIGFDGLIMTDDISMKALAGRPDDLARAALDAGCDVVLHCNGTLEARRAVAGAAGRMDEAAQARAMAALSARTPPDTVDISVLEANLERLMTDGPGDG
ncbi:beta-N-acetylhexosaminidase [Roseovarius sp. TE539]|nr:beta-N-acetylhexosaminidase [Roseovarius sp. TE539]